LCSASDAELLREHSDTRSLSSGEGVMAEDPAEDT